MGRGEGQRGGEDDGDDEVEEEEESQGGNSEWIQFYPAWSDLCSRSKGRSSNEGEVKGAQEESM